MSIHSQKNDKCILCVCTYLLINFSSTTIHKMLMKWCYVNLCVGRHPCHDCVLHE